MMTLVLSPQYEPLNQISLKKAAKLIIKGKVEVLERYEGRIVHAVIGFFPSVVRLLKWFGGRKKGVRFSRENVYTRDKGQCQYCSKKLLRDEATYEHVVPRAQGGKTRWDNIVIACIDCNQKKGNRTPEQACMPLRVKPACPKYLPETLRLNFTEDQTPKSWLNYLQSVVYMNVELDSD
jgi:5-methylcytosine-specific restriction endonuclease McrA